MKLQKGIVLPRKKRVWYPGAIYHVMSRGNRRGKIFKDEYDYVEFLEELLLVKDIYPFKIHSMCLMSNHFHILIETEGTELWRIMFKVLKMYASNFNLKYRLTGHLFESRYTAQIVEDEPYFLEVSRYIHLNPVKAKMVQSPRDYVYSSFGLFVDDQHSAGDSEAEVRAQELIAKLVDTERVLDYFNHGSKDMYHNFVESKISHVEQERLIRKSMNEEDLSA